MKFFLSDTTFMYILIWLVHFFVLFNSVLVTLGLPYFYIAGMSIIIFTVLIKGIYRSHFSRFIIHLIYTFILFLLAVYHVTTMNAGTSALLSFGLYTLPLLSWILVYSRYNGELFKELFIGTYRLSVFVSFLGIIQYFFSPSLFGFIPVNSRAIEWAIGKSFAEYSVFFRATSTLGSPQVFGLFCVLTLILGERFKNSIPKRTFLVGRVLLIFGGALSGNKLFFLILFGYFFFSYLPRIFVDFKKMSMAFILIFSVTAGVASFGEKIPMLERVFSIDSVKKQEKEDSRLARYEYILINTNIIKGNGLGIITNQSHNELRAAESYIFKVYYEAGVAAFFFLILILLFTGVIASAYSYHDGLVIFFLIISLIIVHAFESPVFFIFWGYMLSFFVMKGRLLHDEIS